MPVYLDHNATTPLRDEARRAMEPFLGGVYGNPSSVHGFGQEARAGVDRARRAVRELVGGRGGEVAFTGSGTEAVFTALVAGCRARAGEGRKHLVVSAIEHTAGVDAARFLEEEGWEAARAAPDARGRVDPEAVGALLRPDTALVSVLHANNETGVVQPVREIAERCREAGAWVHVDAVQSAGKIAVRAEEWGVDLVSVAAHKLGGPKGVGALWRRRGLRLPAVIPGTQEQGVRGGTLNVPGIAGFGRAAELAVAALEEYRLRTGALRRRLEAGLADRIPGARIVGEGAERLSNTVLLVFPESPDSAERGDAGPDLVPALDLEGFAVSSGSACRSGSPEPSHVLLAMGIPAAAARTAVRVSVGTETTEAEIDAFLQALVRVAG